MTLNKKVKTTKPVVSFETGKPCKQCDGNRRVLFCPQKGVKGGSSQTDYTPFITEGLVSLPDQLHGVPVRLLRGTGAAQSFLLASVVLSDHTATGTHVLVRGFEMTPVQVHFRGWMDYTKSI